LAEVIMPVLERLRTVRYAGAWQGPWTRRER